MRTWLQRALVFSGLWIAVTLPIPTGAQPQPEHPEAKDSTSRSGAKGEPERDPVPLDLLENPNEPEGRLVILPEIKREGAERYFLSSFKLPDKLTFAGQPVPLDNWQVRERIEYEFYQFLEDQGESIILAKRTGRCFPPAESSWRMPACRMISSICCSSRASVWPRPTRRRKRQGPGSSFPPPGGGIRSRAMPSATIAAI